jgi:AcrR family transcriptional regulator
MASSAPEPLSPRAREIVGVARELLESDGPGGLSMRRIAGRLGIRAPSIYKHVPDKQALEAAIVSAGFEEAAERFEAAVRDAPDPLAAVGAAYRAFARDHPHLYGLMFNGPLPRERLVPGVEARAAAPVIEAVGGDEHTARAAFAFAHGMVVLELAGRFPSDADLDAAWARGLDALSTASASPAAGRGGAREGAGPPGRAP